MYVKIHRLNFTQLWNAEYPQFVSQLVAIITRYKPESLHMLKVYARVMAMLPQLDKIGGLHKGSLISNRLKDMDSEREVVIKGIRDQVKTYGKLSLPAMVPHAEVLMRFLDDHGAGLHGGNYHAETIRIDGMISEYDAADAVKIAAGALCLGPLFEHLREVNSRFADLFVQLAEVYLAVEEVNACTLRLNMDKHLVALFNAIEYCSNEYDGLDYRPLAKEVNELVGYYKLQLEMRVARRSHGQDTSAEEPIAKA